MPPTFCTPEEAAAFIRPTDTIGFGLGPANPDAFFTGLGAREDWVDLTFGGALLLGLYPVLLTVQFAVLIWLEILLARSRFIPAMSFVEQPPTYAETQHVQRFQASLSAFSAVWGYMALVAFLFWLLFYAL